MWERVTDLQPYIDSEDWTDEERYDLFTRVYRPKDKKYPLLSISIYANSSYSLGTWNREAKRWDKEPLTGFRISCSHKPEEGAWWESETEDARIPIELFDELQEMLSELRNKIMSGK